MSYPEPHLGFTQLAVGRENRSGKKGKIKGNGTQKRRRLAAFLVLVRPEHISLCESGEGPGSEVLLNRTSAASIRPKKPVGRRERSSARPSSLSSAP